MTGGPSQNPRQLFQSATYIARFQKSAEVGSQHLLLALMSDGGSRWAGILEERGVGTYERPPKNAGPLPPLSSFYRARQPSARHAKPMRRIIVDAFIALFVLVIAFLFGRTTKIRPPEPELPFGDDAQLVLTVARNLAQGDPSDGHILIALASVPGPQIKLLRLEHRVVAAAARWDTGLARKRDKFILEMHQPALRWRRREASFRAARRTKPAFVAMRAWDLFWAAIVFTVDTAVTACMYIFLWPALLLANGLRAVVGRALGVPFTVRRAHEVLGGEMEVQPSASTSDLRTALAIFVPRAVCFLICVTSIVLIFWQTRRLGVQPFALTFARYDIVQGHVEVAPLLAPVLILFDVVYHFGIFLGPGILAGLGAGFLAVPSRREVQLIRLAGGHDVGRGSRTLRIAMAPLVLITALFAAVEAVLPFRGGPLYLTMYALPVLLALWCASAVEPLLPY
jgi:hypothetical protein